MLVIGARPYYLLLHGHDERDKNNTDDGSRSCPISYSCTGMRRLTRIILMVVAAQPHCLLLHGHDEKDKNNAEYGS